MNAQTPITTFHALEETTPIAEAVIRAVAAKEYADSFCGRGNVGRADIDADTDAIDAKQTMLAQFRLIGLDETLLSKMGAIL